MAWLDSGEDISQLLRGTTYGGDTPPPGQALFEVLVLIAICGIWAAFFAAGVMYAWESRFALADRTLGMLVKAVRLKRRIAIAAQNLRVRIEQEVAKKDPPLRG